MTPRHLPDVTTTTGPTAGMTREQRRARRARLVTVATFVGTGLVTPAAHQNPPHESVDAGSAGSVGSSVGSSACSSSVGTAAAAFASAVGPSAAGAAQVAAQSAARSSSHSR